MGVLGTAAGVRTQQGTADPLTESGVCHSFLPHQCAPLRLQNRLSPPSVTNTARGRKGCTSPCPCSTPMCHRECRADPACTQALSYSSPLLLLCLKCSTQKKSGSFPRGQKCSRDFSLRNPLKSRCSSHPCLEQQQQNCFHPEVKEPKPSAENSFFQNCGGASLCSLCCFLDVPPPVLKL